VGRASNRKKVRRQARRSSPQARQGSRATAAPQQALPQPAAAPRWPEGSLGHRLCSSTNLARAQSAPCLLTAEVPDAAVILGDPAHWEVAAQVLVRAMVYDGLRADHPAVARLADVLAPVAETELAYDDEALEDFGIWGDFDEEEDEPEFPVLDGPVFLIGTCALVEATWAVAGDDPLTEVHAVLTSTMEGVVPGLAGRILQAGLAILSALARLGQSSSSSILRPAA
jgi:hypothetical protein